MFLVSRFTLDREPFPDPEDFAYWNSTPLWPGNHPRQSVSYGQQASAVKQYYAQINIFVKKVTHCFRSLGARLLDEAGVPDQVKPP